MKPFAIYHEHTQWFEPLFVELESRDIPYIKIDATANSFDPSESFASKYSLFVNRMSPSSHLRGHESGIFHTQAVLSHAELNGVRVVNGSKAYSYEISKARQLDLLHRLGLGYPKSRVINSPALALTASDGLRFPVVVKANIGGSGAGIFRFDSRDELEAAVSAGTIDLGLDSTALVQEYVPARDGHITRVETLNGKYLYAINIYSSGDSFNLCPADICQIGETKQAMRIDATTPSDEVIKAVEEISIAAGLDVGGIELMVDDRDGKTLYYDINALSNFVGDWQTVLGYNPHVQLVDMFEAMANGLGALGQRSLD
jgi:glutathione synthase/RimK-type ligase-like ATP-grasp enzyme